MLPIATPNDVVTTIPYLIGEPPEPSLIMLPVQGGRVLYATCSDLQDTPAARAEPAVNAAQDNGAQTLVVVGYGTAEQIQTPMSTLIEVARHKGLEIHDALRVKEGRIYPMLCEGPTCCRPEGTEVDPGRSTGPAEAVLAGLSRTPSFRERDQAVTQETRLAPQAAPEVVEQATADAEAEVERLRLAGVRVLRRCGAGVVRAAVNAEKTGSGPTRVEELVRLAVFLREQPVRDYIWADILPGTAPAHRELWERVTRTARLSDQPAPACLLAIAAWMQQDTGGARAALRVAEKADHTYTLAHLVREALNVGLPVEVWLEHLGKR